MSVEAWLLLAILAVLAMGLIRIYDRLDTLRRYHYNVSLTVSHKDSDNCWSFFLEIDTKIPVVLGQFLQLEPYNIRVDTIMGNNDLSATISHSIEFDDPQIAYNYMADLLYCGHWKFSPLPDQQIPEEVEILIKNHW